jgi:hypothetical protein
MPHSTRSKDEEGWQGGPEKKGEMEEKTLYKVDEAR